MYEQGYDFVACVRSHRVPERLRLEEGLKWEKLSRNGFLAESKDTSLIVYSEGQGTGVLEGPSPAPCRIGYTKPANYCR